MYRPVKSKVNINDRFIPRRMSANIILNNAAHSPGPQEYEVDRDKEFANYAKVRYYRANYQRALKEIMFPLETRVLNFFSPKKYSSNRRFEIEETWPVKPRKKPVIGAPFVVLDMPQFDFDIRHQVADWSSNNCLATIFENEIHMWCLESPGSTPGSTCTKEKVQYSVKWKPDGTQIAVGIVPNKLGIYDIAHKKILYETICCFSTLCSVYALEWVDNNCLVSGCNNGVLRIMSSDLQEIKRARANHKSAIVTIKTSCNKTYLATSSLDKTVLIWKLPEFNGYFKIILSEVMSALAWHPWKNGVLAVGLIKQHKGRVVIWNVDMKKSVACESTTYPNSSIDCLSFNPISGELVVSNLVRCESDETKYIGIISVLSNIDEVVEELHIHNGSIPYLLWGYGGKLLSSISADENLCIWEFFGPTENQSQTNKKVKKSTNQKHFESVSLFGASIR